METDWQLAYSKRGYIEMTDMQIIQWLQDLKQSDTEQQSEIQQLKHLMATLKIFDLNGDNDQQIKELESWVNIVFKNELENLDCESPMFRLQIEFLKEIYLMFSYCSHFSRAIQAISIANQLNHKYPDDICLAKIYAEMLLDQNIEVCVMKTQDLTSLFELVDQLVLKHNFEEDFKTMLTFKRNLLQLKHCFIFDDSTKNELNSKILEYIQKSRNIEDIDLFLTVMLLNPRDFDFEYLSVSNTLRNISESLPREGNFYYNFMKKQISIKLDIAQMKHLIFLDEKEQVDEFFTKINTSINECLDSLPNFKDLDSDSQIKKNEYNWLIGRFGTIKTLSIEAIHIYYTEVLNQAEFMKMKREFESFITKCTGDNLHKLNYLRISCLSTFLHAMHYQNMYADFNTIREFKLLIKIK